jgi:hypothetical protein
MVAAPLLLLGSSLTDDGTAGLLQVVAMAMFIAAVLALVARIAEAAPRAAALLLLIGCLGCTGGIGYGFNLIAISHGYDLDLETGAAVILKITGLCFPLTFLGLGLALLKTRTAPAAAAAAVALGAVLFPVSRIGDISALSVVVDVLFLIGLTAIALTGRNTREPVTSRASVHAAGS